MEARLHTAVSSGLVYSTISVHRLEHLMVPRFCVCVVQFLVSGTQNRGRKISNS
jgi:hypothetical protein